MRFVSDIAVGLACFSAALAVLTYALRRGALQGDARRVAWFAIIGLACFGLSRVLDAVDIYAPATPVIDSLEIISVGLALTLSLACWGFVPGLIMAPSASDLLAEKARLEQAVADRTRALDEANQRFVHALKTTRVSMAQQDLDLRYQWVHNLPDGMEAQRFLGHLPSEVMPADTQAVLREAGLRAIAERKLIHSELSFEIDGATHYFDQAVEPLWCGGEVVGLLTTAIDATDHRRRQQELESLMRELTHRTKNLLAVIQGIARQSSRSAPDVETFVRSFDGRIRALAQTHELLVQTEWRGVDLRELVTAIWRAASPVASQAIAIRGPACRLSPECAQSLGLALHEMAVNAEAHLIGAGSPDVAISWLPCKIDGFAGVELLWRERGAHSADAPKGFGMTFVENLLPRAVDGTSHISYDGDGMLWTLRIDGSHLRAPATAPVH